MNVNQRKNPGVPLKLTLEQCELSAELRQIVSRLGAFDTADFEQQPLAIGFLDALAIAIEFAGKKKDEKTVANAFQLAFNYYGRLLEDEPQDDENDQPPF